MCWWHMQGSFRQFMIYIPLFLPLLLIYISMPSDWRHKYISQGFVVKIKWYSNGKSTPCCLAASESSTAGHGDCTDIPHARKGKLGAIFWGEEYQIIYGHIKTTTLFLTAFFWGISKDILCTWSHNMQIRRNTPPPSNLCAFCFTAFPYYTT